ncbi:MAG: hypothetical protein A2176_00625 [Spirochaetes bacterium RBG_13_51_14]|nr:MAG: hypothetical protein A2176_00625 [Spirochaetes bacterium RBG_13_51_14]
MIEKSQKEFAVEKYQEADLNQTHRFFIGVPQRHPEDDKILILLTDPFSKHKEFYEFSIDSIGHLEEIGTIANEDGESAMQVRVWVKKGMTAIKAKPFIVK